MSFRAAISAVVMGAILAVSTAGAPAAAPETRAVNDFPVASDVRVGGDDTQTRFVVDLSSKIEVRAFTLANPYRVVVDMPQVTFALPAKVGEKGKGLVKAFRFGLVMQGGSRMVLDLARPAKIERAFVLDPANDQPARLVLDLSTTDRDAFMRTIALNNRAPDRSLRKYEPETDAKNGDGKNSADKSSDSRPLVVIDPGHGGIDAGTRLAPTDHPEKSIVLEFGLLLRDKLEKSGKYRIVMTRTDDTFVPLPDRVTIAREHKASLFISIHADALQRGEGEAQGATIYTLSETASDAAAARLAEAENRADVIAGLDLSAESNDVADILIDLAKRETKTFSVQFARALANELRNATKLHKEPLKSAGFVVLKAPDIPSVLIELGYVTNRQDLKSMTSDTWRSRTADAVAQAIDSFFAGRTAGRSTGRN
jgi:N-acetylmuramoyl-L-alanine amidase